MFKAARSLATFAATYWRSYTSFGQFMLALAVVAIGVDAAICYKYGITQTFWHGVGFALLAIVVAVMPDAAAQEWDKGAKSSAVAIMGATLLMLPVAYQSHLGYSASVRVGDINVTRAKSEMRDNDVDSIAQARKDKEMAEAAIKRLSWLPVEVTASGVRASIANMEGDQVYRRSKQCSNVTLPESRAFCDRLTDLRKQLAGAESLDAEKARLAAANAWLDRAKDKLASAGAPQQSAVVNQTNVAAQLWLTLTGTDAEKAINPDAVTTTFVNTGIAGANSLAFMLMAPLCWFVAGRNRKPDTEMPQPEAANDTMPGSTLLEVPPIEQRFAPPPHRSPTVHTATIADLRRRLAAA